MQKQSLYFILRQFASFQLKSEIANLKRTTTTDLAKVAGVSLSTVDRVLNGRGTVRPSTAERVLEAAEEIGFYGEAAIRDRLSRSRPTSKLGVLLQHKESRFYENFAHELRSAAVAFEGAKVEMEVEYLEDLSPDSVAAKVASLGKRADVIGIVAAQHPTIARSIEIVRERGVPTFGLISEISAQCSVGYLGLDNWKVGRTAAWAFANICKKPGKIAIMVGNHRYRCQELNEIGFRSFFRAQAPEFEITESMSTWEDNNQAEKLTRALLKHEPDLRGLYVAGGGLMGVINALRDDDNSRDLAILGYQLTDATRSALADGVINVVISHPLKSLARETVIAMTAAVGHNPENSLPSITLPLEINTPENT